MDRKRALKNSSSEKLFSDIGELHNRLSEEFSTQFNRSLPFADVLLDRWERAKKLNFGEGSSIYDSAFVFGKVVVGNQCWIGPNTIVDGSGGLTIGEHCTISAGVHIYTHDNLKQTLSAGKLPIEHAPVSIGKCTYIGPQSIITKGISIGNYCVVAANSLVNRNVADYTIVGGNPARVLGKVVIQGDQVELKFEKE